MFSIDYTKSFVVKPNSTVTSTLNLIESSQSYYYSSEMLRFVIIVHDEMCKTFLIFFHSLHALYHHIMTNLMIFRLCLFFLQFKNTTATRSWSCFLNKMFEISFHFMGQVSNWAK